MFPEIMKPLNVVGDIVFQIFIGLLQLLIKLTLTQLTKKELGKQKRTWMTVYMRRTACSELNKFLFYIRAPWLLHFKNHCCSLRSGWPLAVRFIHKSKSFFCTKSHLFHIKILLSSVYIKFPSTYDKWNERSTFMYPDLLLTCHKRNRPFTNVIKKTVRNE